MRGLFIAGGIGLLTRFAWISYLFGAILLVAAIRLVLPEEDDHGEGKTPNWVKWISRIHPVSLRTDRFFTTGGQATSASPCSSSASCRSR